MSKKTLNAENLARLGADRLAELMIEVSTGSADIKRRLRLELSHNLGAQELGRDVRKRLVTLRRAKSTIGWRKRKAFFKDLHTQADMITARIAPEDPALGLDLLWQFLELVPSVYSRTDDSRGEISDVFGTALSHIGPIAENAMPDPKALADRVWEAVTDNGFGEFDGVIVALAPALGSIGFDRLTAQVDAYEAEPLQDPEMDHEALAFLRALRSESGNYHAEKKARLIRQIRQQIAQASGDTDALIAQYSPAALSHPETAAEIAARLIDKDRAQEALQYLKDAAPDELDQSRSAWDATYIRCLQALGQPEQAQAHHWTCFVQTLDADHLRAHLKLLPDFDDVEAEDAARDHALGYADAMRALSFLIAWPDLPGAATLVLNRHHELDAERSDVLTPAADALRVRFPLAATLILRAMILEILDLGASRTYTQAAELLADCAALDAEIADYGDLPDHTSFLRALVAQYPRKSAFWDKVSFAQG
ncbi:DUF6880 family protein [Pelagimonas varians]|uniref:Uncharacterized protein n=1 Tax=Pelagimonas varians TaxID=696760 RepID=A0A238L134_9RHOB|nr:DUF6880 family protein [Pelagimonas varians]PYG27205.1 hypothetical protein C8N36_11751 [Pelagimonas varians]SMX48729.1 hypothetical protein PEV8663_03930 [Pelagimonas varians]